MKLAAAAAAFLIAMTVAVGGASAASSSQIHDAQSYIRKHGSDANRVQANVLLAQIALLQMTKSATQTNLNKLAITAQQSHDNLDAIRDNFAETGSGALGNAELLAFSGANDLKNAMGALVAWTGDPNAATLAHFVSQYKTARSEWNTGIRTIWTIARRTHPPTV